MNTIRFFLLLVSIFFFAFLFQINAFRQSKSREEVLSGNASSPMTARITPSSIPKEVLQTILLQYRYPNSDLLIQEEAMETLVSGDGLEQIVTWYAIRLHTTYSCGDKFEGKKDKIFFLTGTEKKNKITVKINQSRKSPFIIIVVSITAS